MNSSLLQQLSLSLMFLCSCQNAVAANSFTFSGGAPLDEYQPRVIISILTEAFAHHDIEFNAVHLPSLRSLEITNSGKLDGELHRVSNFKELTNNKYSNLVRIETKLLSVTLTVYATQNLSVSNWADLRNYNIAYHLERKDVANFLATNVKTDFITKVRSDRQAFGMLAGWIWLFRKV